MMLYALGALRLFDSLYDITEVSMSIYQPRRENVSTWTISVDELNAWAENTLKPKAKLAHKGEGEYGGSVGALKSMGALEMGVSEDELKPLVDAWRTSNPRIVQFWWDVDREVKRCVKERCATETHGLRFTYQSGFLFITLPSGRRLAYVKPKIGENRFGGESVTYEGVGGTKKWERLESYGPKFVENCVQATARDILMYAMQTLRCCSIVAHVHDELIQPRRIW